eukprot:GEZU01017724.1.p1 GENE.GEZU01017724.1~~GEZU01017724.1.p1  ORF type:complete len:204 (-),score=57.76 GEZU01017724.1:137-748(-)
MTTPPSEIKFYSQIKEYGFFSNFSAHPIWLDDKKWPTTEHYFQAKKFPGTTYEEEIRAARSPGDAKKMGCTRKVPLRKDWEQVKEDIMFKACYAKFTQHKDLRRAILDTGDAILIEHTHNDSYWGDGGDGTGKNRLGHVLMLVRDAIRNEKQASNNNNTTTFCTNNNNNAEANKPAQQPRNQRAPNINDSNAFPDLGGGNKKR